SVTSVSTTGTGLFSQPSTGITSTSTVGSLGLGGTGNFSLGGTSVAGSATGNSVGVTGLAASGNPMEGEVPKQVMDLVTQLKEQIRTNKEKADEFAMDSSDACIHIDEKLDVVKRLQVQYCSELRRAVKKVNVLLKKGERDVYAGEQLARKQKEAGKNPHYGQNVAMEYLQGACCDYETNLMDLDGKLQQIESVISQRKGEQDKPQVSKEDLTKFLECFDQIFKSVASEVYEINQQVQEAKETYLEIRKATQPFAPNPFAKRMGFEKLSNSSHFSRSDLGADAFPSQVTMMKIGELARVATPAANPLGGGSSAFGTTGSLFGSKPLGPTPFSFNTPTTSSSLFKPFSATATSSAPLFGATKTTSSTATSSVPPFAFGNTLNSTASGTLFGGSASKPFGK
ncbi:unnamed protein product, partial [Enterobius vermicularis]|uniref:Nucleoporin p58/p45 n=1 Tax=Enterobius vermicularis TaxID=51028 RepID=A0A0N4UVU9_ENTVE